MHNSVIASSPDTQPRPTAQAERISSIDTLRGFALLGILIMNISAFALPGAFDYSPFAMGPTSRFNVMVWAVRFVLFDGKMRAIFSMLFGAGVILLTGRLEARNKGEQAADIFTRRNMWLTLFGILHSYFIWFGDILYFYGITALLFLYPCRKLKARTLLIAGVLHICNFCRPSCGAPGRSNSSRGTRGDSECSREGWALTLGPRKSGQESLG